MNVNQTMCPDMNMSVTMLDATKAGHQDFDKTRFVENDMSFDQTGILPKRRVSICPTNQLKYVIIIILYLLSQFYFSKLNFSLIYACFLLSQGKRKNKFFH